MGFKLKGAPYDKSNMNIAVYKKDLTDGSIGKSNHTGIIVQSGISPEEEQHVIAHEKVHQEQQAKGDLDYDKENFYWKGKTYPRANLNEHNEQLPWEKEAYKASEKSRNKESEEMGSTKFKLNGHRGNNKPFSQMTSRGLIGASMYDGASENEDPKTTKTKVKTNRKGETVTKNITKNSETGRKTKSVNTKGPVTTTTTPAPPDTKIEINTPETVTQFKTVPIKESTPGSSTEGDNKPFVKPLKVTGYKEAYNKTDKSIPYKDFETKAIKWNKENPGKKSPPKIEKLPIRPAVQINPGIKRSMVLKGAPTISTSTYETNKTKTRANNKDKNKVNDPKVTKYKEAKVCTPQSTDVSCLGGGKSGIFGLKTKKGGVTSKSGKKLAKSERKANKKTFAPLAAAKESIALGSAGRKQKRGRASADRRAKIKQFFA